jgi:hypothetical protein
MGQVRPEDDSLNYKGLIIGLSGQARTGKDTFANYIARDYRFTRIGLADPMKRFCKEVFDFSDDQLWGDARDKADGRYFRGVVDPDSLSGNYLSPRYALQTLGTEWGRDCYPNVWIDYGVRIAKELIDEGYATYTEKEGLVLHEKDQGLIGGVVFSDLRFKNEILAIREAGGVLIRIKREGFDGQVGLAGHASEQEQKSIPDSDFDYVIQNPPGLMYYYSEIDALMRKIRPHWPWEAVESTG